MQYLHGHTYDGSPFNITNTNSSRAFSALYYVTKNPEPVAIVSLSVEDTSVAAVVTTLSVLSKIQVDRPFLILCLHAVPFESCAYMFMQDWLSDVDASEEELPEIVCLRSHAHHDESQETIEETRCIVDEQDQAYQESLHADQAKVM